MNGSPPSLFLSKSLFIRGLQCHKSLYLHKCRPELRDEISESQQALFDSGHEVGRLAQQLFPGGVETPYEGLSIAEQVKQTQSEISRGTTTIYEASFSYNNIFIKVDILQKGIDGWQIYEVKSSTEVKAVHVDDIALQYCVLTGCGLDVNRVFVVYINNQYVRQGEIEIEKLFIAEDLTEAVTGRQGFVAEEITRMREAIIGGMPDIDIGRHCSAPYDCDFRGFCWQHVPAQSVFDLKGRGVDKFDLYRQGIIRLEDVPKDILPEKQLMQVECSLGKKNIVNTDRIREFLSSLWYPLCFLDFETMYMVPVPLFDETRPYQPIPFQYSLHIMDQEHSRPRYYEYLAPAHTDPRRELVEKLLGEIPAEACVLAYNMSYEAGILAGLMDRFPEYARQLETIINNLRDLMMPFKNRDVYYWTMKGAYSLKAVLPALVPDMSYEQMEISDGQMASRTWLQLWDLENTQEIENKRNALIEYCRQDTLAMVKILEKIKELC